MRLFTSVYFIINRHCDQKKGAPLAIFQKMIKVSISQTFVSSVRFISSFTVVITNAFEMLNSLPWTS